MFSFCLCGVVRVPRRLSSLETVTLKPHSGPNIQCGLQIGRPLIVHSISKMLIQQLCQKRKYCQVDQLNRSDSWYTTKAAHLHDEQYRCVDTLFPSPDYDSRALSRTPSLCQPPEWKRGRENVTCWVRVRQSGERQTAEISIPPVHHPIKCHSSAFAPVL